ncbi:MAG: class I SAM-dependent methyltransferase [Deltaproteobacteria bacterium]|nr:class I SAM-dependent methyltransferase [Deltaproteobacteria bacterium]
MGTVYRTPPRPPIGTSPFIATSAYEGVRIGYAKSLAETTAELARHGIPFELGMMHGECHVDDGRNALVRDFLTSNCTDLVFIDADVEWSPETFMRLLTWDEDLIAGAYPKKCTPTKFPIGRILHARENDLLEVSFAPTGFMRIRRSVFEKLRPHVSKAGKTAIFFERRFNTIPDTKEQTRDGGDVTFCRRWIAAGGKVVVDPNMTFSHIGEHRWVGKFAQYLEKDEHKRRHIDPDIDPATKPRQKADEPLPAEEQVFKFDPDALVDVDSAVFQEMANTWGNKPWAAPPDFVEAAYRMALNLPEGSTILECGSGLTTLVLAAAAKTRGLKLVACEQDRLWAERVDRVLQAFKLEARILCAPVIDDWYSIGKQIDGLGAAMVVIDGPRRNGGGGVNRSWPIRKESVEQRKIVRPDAAVIMDDVNRVRGPNMTCVPAGTQQRPWCVGRLGPPLKNAA